MPACSHMRSEEKSRDIFLNGSETETVRSTAVAASSEAMFFVLYGPLVSLVVQLYVLVSLARPSLEGRGSGDTHCYSRLV